jgi:hypothetical protein
VNDKSHLTDQLLTMVEIAYELRCSKAHVSHLLNGKVSGVPSLPAITLGRRRLIRRSTFENWKALCEAPLRAIDCAASQLTAVNA